MIYSCTHIAIVNVKGLKTKCAKLWRGGSYARGKEVDDDWFFAVQHSGVKILVVLDRHNITWRWRGGQVKEGRQLLRHPGQLEATATWPWLHRWGILRRRPPCTQWSNWQTSGWPTKHLFADLQCYPGSHYYNHNVSVLALVLLQTQNPQHIQYSHTFTQHVWKIKII